MSLKQRIENLEAANGQGQDGQWHDEDDDMCEYLRAAQPWDIKNFVWLGEYAKEHPEFMQSESLDFVGAFLDRNNSDKPCSRQESIALYQLASGCLSENQIDEITALLTE